MLLKLLLKEHSQSDTIMPEFWQKHVFKKNDENMWLPQSPLPSSWLTWESSFMKCYNDEGDLGDGKDDDDIEHLQQTTACPGQSRTHWLSGEE